MFFATSFLSEQRQKDTFSQLLCIFSWDYWEKDNGCHNVAKKWTINLKTKTKEKSSLKSASLVELHKNTGPNLCFSTYIKSLFHLNYHYLKLSWRNISVLPFQKLKSTRERIIRTFVSNFKTSHSIQTFILISYSNQPLSDKFLRFSLKIRSLVVRSQGVNRARNNTYFAKSKRRYFLFAPHPYTRDRTALNNSPPPGQVKSL